MENKARKFVELAEKRVNKTLADLRLVGNLSNRNNYIYSKEQAMKICNSLEGEIKNIKNRFISELSKSTSGFKL
jgi:hypothetical protein